MSPLTVNSSVATCMRLLPVMELVDIPPNAILLLKSVEVLKKVPLGQSLPTITSTPLNITEALLNPISISIAPIAIPSLLR